jgi:hypothetical protein
MSHRKSQLLYLIPVWSDVALTTIVALAALLVGHATLLKVRFFDLITPSKENATILLKEASLQANNFFKNDVFDKIGLALFWGGIGLLIVYGLWITVNTFIELKNTAVLLKSFDDKKSTNAILGDLGVRLGLSFGPWLWLALVVKVLYPLWHKTFGIFLLNPGTGKGVLSLTVALVGCTLTFLFTFMLVRLMRKVF